MATSKGADNGKNISGRNSQPVPDLMPEIDSAPRKPTDTGDIKPVRARKSPKPLVEGINTPVVGAPLAAPVAPEPPESAMLAGQSTVIPPKITLTSSEKQLIAEPTAVPPSVPAAAEALTSPPKIFPAPLAQKITLAAQKPPRKLIWSLLISLLAVCLVFGILLWHNNQTGGSGLGFSLLPKRPAAVKPDGPPAPNPAPAASPATTTPAVIPAASSTPPAAISSSSPAAVNNPQVKVTNTPTGYLNVRNAPSTSGKLLTRVHPGEIYGYTQTKNGWYYITLLDGSQGWVTGQYAQAVR